MGKQQGLINQWQDFEKQIEDLNNWFKDTESKFRNQALQASLPDKEAQLKHYCSEREVVSKKEQEIDNFVDSSHGLLQISEVQRIKPIISQISTRYQNIHALAKEIMGRWQNIVDEQQRYGDKYEDVVTWLTVLEEHVNSLRQGDLSNNAEAKSSRLQMLLSEKDQGEHKITGLTLNGEKLYPDTAASGREQIRNELRAVRERWDKVHDAISEQQKLQDAQSLQLSSYQEMLQQTLAWLEYMEKAVQVNPATWSNMQEVKAKLMKQKNNLQDVISHKKVVEGITEKAGALMQLTTSQEIVTEIQDSVKQMNDRYQNVFKNVKDAVTLLQSCLDFYQQFNDLHKTQQDYQRQLWDKLKSHTDYTGSKQVLQQRLNQVVEIQEGLPSGTITLKELEDHVASNLSVLPARSQEAMQRDVANLKFDLDKFVGALADLRSALENRLQQWNEYEVMLDNLLSWLADAEQSLRSYALKSTIDEKQEQLEKYKVSISCETFQMQLLSYAIIRFFRFYLEQ